MSVSKILELYARSGRSLMSHGLKEAALPLSEAGIALMLFEQLNWLVLGGDVYLQADSEELESTYENWFYEGNSSSASISAASNFMDRLAGDTVYIVFVLDHS